MPDLSTRTSRRKLDNSSECHWTRIARGRALGYRRPRKGDGTWYVRVFTKGSSGSPYKKKVLGTADDKLVANGSTVLSYGQAAQIAAAWDPERPGSVSPLTVAQAVERYLDWYREHRKSYVRVRQLFRANVLPELGDRLVADLTQELVRSWHEGIANRPARLRGGQERLAKTDEQRRARKVTANRALASLKAALNRCWHDGLLEDRAAWLRVQPYRGVEQGRTRYLEPEQVRRLLNSCQPDFRNLVLAAVYTGARYAELAALRAGDVRADVAAIHIPKSKTDTSRFVYLPTEASVFFEGLSVGKDPNAILLLRADGQAWGPNHQARRMRDACTIANIEPLGFHQLRHTYASLYLMSGGSLVALAKQLGHSTTRMVEKHYGHLADSWRANEAAQHAPQLGLTAPNVRRLAKVPG